MANRHKLSRFPLDGIFSEDEKFELRTRDIVLEFRDEETGKLLDEHPELEKALFEVVYPSFGSRQIATRRAC